LSPPSSLVERFAHGGGSLVAEVSGAHSDRQFVFLHGWGHSRESLRGISVLFQHTARVHLIDLPGFGEAPLPPSSWGTLDYADLVQQYLLERVHGETILVGHSFGTLVTLRLAARRLPQIRAVVLMSAPGLPPAGLSWRRVRRLGLRVLRQVFRQLQPLTGPRLVEWHTRRFGSRDYLAAGDLRPILVRTVNEDLSETARTVACPVLLIYGTDDDDTPPSLGYRYRDLMEGRATLELLLHKDHHLYAGTGAHLCGFKIRTWLGHIGQEGREGQAGNAGQVGLTGMTNGAGRAGRPEAGGAEQE
jgi:pimeloyl-ACP methyl ester carboxylesterase